MQKYFMFAKKGSSKSSLKVYIIGMLEIIDTIQLNLDVQQIVSVI